MENVSTALYILILIGLGMCTSVFITGNTSVYVFIITGVFSDVKTFIIKYLLIISRIYECLDF